MWKSEVEIFGRYIENKNKSIPGKKIYIYI